MCKRLKAKQTSFKNHRKVETNKKWQIIVTKTFAYSMGKEKKEDRKIFKSISTYFTFYLAWNIYKVLR